MSKFLSVIFATIPIGGIFNSAFAQSTAAPPVANPVSGPVATIGETHRAVREWSAASGYRLAGPHWEIYGDPDPVSGHFNVQVLWSLVTL